MCRFHVSIAICVAASFPAAAQSQGSSPSAGSAKDQGGTSGMKNMGKGSDMSGMNMQQMMAHCDAMHAQMKQGKPLTADMQKMMKECDEMDRQMQAPMPNGTKSR